MDVRLTAIDDIVRQFEELFVNRRAYTVQSIKPNPESGRHYYYRPTVKGTGEALGLSQKTIRQHLEGDITIMERPLRGIKPASVHNRALGSEVIPSSSRP